MVVNDDSIISYIENERERKEEVYDKVKSEEIKDNENISDKKANIENKNDDKKGIGNVIYINVRGRLCAATPDSIISNRTPRLLLKNIILLKNIKSIFALMKVIVLLVGGKVLTLVPNLIFVIMAQVIVNLKRVQVFESENGSNVNLVFNEQIDGFERQVDANGAIDFAEAKVSSVSIGRSALTAQLCDVCDDIAAYRGSIDHAFVQKEFGILLRGAALTLERSLHNAGEVYGQDENGTDLAYQRDCYTTEVVGVKLSAWSMDKIDAALTL